MATPKVTPKSYTLDEYRAFTTRPENADRLFELVDGDMVEKTPSFKPSKIAIRLASEISLYQRDNPVGEVTGADGGYVMANGDVLIPDVGYVLKAQLPEEPEREAPIPPDLAIEVKSPTDRKRALRMKAEHYLAQGTRLVWLVFPEERVIEVYALHVEEVVELKIDDILDGGEVLPNFKLPLAQVFA